LQKVFAKYYWLSLYSSKYHPPGCSFKCSIYHPSSWCLWISEHGLSPETPQKGDEKLDHTFPFPTQRRRAAGPKLPVPPAYRTLPPPRVTPLPTSPAKRGSRGWGDSGTRRMEGVSIVKELVGSRYGVECE